MEDFWHSSHRVAGGEASGRNFEIINANMLKYVKKVCFARPRLSYDPSPPFDQKPVEKKKKKKKKKKSSPSSSISTWFSEPAIKRKTRLTKYKMYTLEGQIKDSLKKGHKWIKKKYRKLVYGY
ncbi:hypothetical protein V6N13_082593 [Hibiscus sabdariffa]|uniref:Uncharacterized protein n=1 Tax=Hibiscus sabdariffa TaxID=183260 RepID=A0ABR2Q3U9_9ROSI